MSVWEDFRRRYVQPRMERIIVGFSGIDPDEYRGTLTDEQINIIRDLILAYLGKLTIRIDSGSLDPNEPPPEVQPIALKPAEIPHELLDELLGGTIDGHYHLTEDELQKLLKVLAVLFPDGATEPKFPSVPASDDSSGEGEDEAEWGGLPKGTPPAWTQVNIPSGYTAWSGFQKMYYGAVPYTKNGTRNELLAVMQNSSGNRRIMRTLNLSTWNEMVNMLKGSGTGIDYVGDAVYDYLCLSGNSAQYLYVMYKRTSGNNLQYVHTYNESGSTSLGASTISSQSKSENVDSFIACCYSPSLNMSIFVNNGGKITCVKDNKAVTTTGYKNLSLPFGSVFPRGAAWNSDAQTFCVVGYSLMSGVGAVGCAAVSSNGQTWSFKEIGINLTDVSYRSDLGCLFARCINNGHFYVSGDGLNWQQHSQNPIPVSDTNSNSIISDYTPKAAFAYNSMLGWYCVVGGTSKTAYFSKDLKHWVSTTVRNAGDIEMGDVIWAGGSINKFVMIPKSGNQFYTFDPASWSD